MNVNEVPIFVSSADSYADIWPAFFALLKREWPEYKGTIYLNTEKLDFKYEGFNIVCTKLGRQQRFVDTFKAGIDCVPGDHFLLLMIDYFIEQRVNVPRLQNYYDIFLKESPDTFTLNPNVAARNKVLSEYDGVMETLTSGPSWKYMFGFQTAFWRKDSIKKILRTWESPWHSEYFGSFRAAKLKMRFLVLADKDHKPIAYDDAGVLHGGGKWYRPALAKIDLAGIPLDFATAKRSYYVGPKSFFEVVYRHLWNRLTTFPTRARSYWSVLTCHE